jgi:hypothetical protein
MRFLLPRLLAVAGGWGLLCALSALTTRRRHR